MKVREVLALLKADGWNLKSYVGSHRQFVHPAKRGNVTVAGQPADDVPPGTLKNMLSQAGWRKQQ
jgi:predicted RNA binding protein YcfA (HicA-like mRNA interferase family)